ncbi:alpha/beta fold hydrolase [Rhodococcus sp. WMMA185]|uniref:alpha/beta fold hydrolase n=1 Tax=Rhodococcus sp. WMMA185 TaxID=679318 RepID=UPI000877F896|nr:alpha/beta fold hydrolase [Rhodococcus sp. WMMA185]
MHTRRITSTQAGIDIAYWDSYDLPSSNSADVHPVPVVLVHGMGGDGGTWDRFARALIGSGRRVIVLDLRGHGRSARAASYLFEDFGADLVELCDNLDMDRVDFVGHSLGGHAASLAAQARPALVRRMAIEEAPLPLRPGDPVQIFAHKLPSPTELWHATTSLIRHPRAAFAFDRSMTASALEQFRRPNPLWWNRLSQIEAETLILRGGSGGMVDPHRLESAVAAIPKCRVVVFPGGHSIHRDRYDDFAGVTIPFLMAPESR